MGNSEGSSQGALGALAVKQTPATAGKQLEQCPPKKLCSSQHSRQGTQTSLLSVRLKNKKNNINLPSLRRTVGVFWPNAATGLEVPHLRAWTAHIRELAVSRARHLSRVSVCVFFFYGTRLPGRALISGSGQHAVSGSLHLPRLQHRGERDSRDQSGDQRSVVSCLSVCPSTHLPTSLPAFLPPCLPACLPDWLTDWLAHSLTDSIHISPSCIMRRKRRQEVNLTLPFQQWRSRLSQYTKRYACYLRAGGPDITPRFPAVFKKNFFYEACKSSQPLSLHLLHNRGESQRLNQWFSMLGPLGVAREKIKEKRKKMWINK